MFFLKRFILQRLLWLHEWKTPGTGYQYALKYAELANNINDWEMAALFYDEAEKLENEFNIERIILQLRAYLECEPIQMGHTRLFEILLGNIDKEDYSNDVRIQRIFDCYNKVILKNIKKAPISEQTKKLIAESASSKKRTAGKLSYKPYLARHLALVRVGFPTLNEKFDENVVLWLTTNKKKSTEVLTHLDRTLKHDMCLPNWIVTMSFSLMYIYQFKNQQMGEEKFVGEIARNAIKLYNESKEFLKQNNAECERYLTHFPNREEEDIFSNDVLKELEDFLTTHSKFATLKNSGNDNTTAPTSPQLILTRLTANAGSTSQTTATSADEENKSDQSKTQLSKSTSKAGTAADSKSSTATSSARAIAQVRTHNNRLLKIINTMHRRQKRQTKSQHNIGPHSPYTEEPNAGSSPHYETKAQPATAQMNEWKSELGSPEPVKLSSSSEPLPSNSRREAAEQKEKKAEAWIQQYREQKEKKATEAKTLESKALALKEKEALIARKQGQHVTNDEIIAFLKKSISKRRETYSPSLVSSVPADDKEYYKNPILLLRRLISLAKTENSSKSQQEKHYKDLVSDILKRNPDFFIKAEKKSLTIFIQDKFLGANPNKDKYREICRILKDCNIVNFFPDYAKKLMEVRSGYFSYPSLIPEPPLPRENSQAAPFLAQQSLLKAPPQAQAIPTTRLVSEAALTL